MKNTKKVKILVAMSGGVDSSVTAALLQKKGYDVVGVFLRLWKEKKGKLAEGQNSAKEIARILDIPLKVIDVSKEFKKEVIDYLLSEFKSGRTPNPCVVCNPRIKFMSLIKLADELGANFVATGHYAIIKKCKVQSARCKIKEEFFYNLFEAEDKNKDQSYFLYGLSQKQLARIIFPLGNYLKPEVKEMARKMGLPVYNREESHDVCFVSGKLEEYLKKNLKLKKGKIVDREGKILGEHRGLPLYTIGQRKGINLGGPGPYYVIGKNILKNELVITDQGRDLKLFRKLMLVEKISWIDNVPKFPLKANIRIRYGHPAVGGIIKSRIDANKKTNKHEYLVEFKKPQRAITPGQSAVFYKKNGEVIGGGIISIIYNF